MNKLKVSEKNNNEFELIWNLKKWDYEISLYLKFGVLFEKFQEKKSESD